MILFRWSLLRRIYVYLLNLMTRIAYKGNLRRAHPDECDPRVQKIRRINSELAFGPGEWEGAFLDDHHHHHSVQKAPGSPSAASRSAPVPLFHLEDVVACLRDGVDAIVGDSLTQCFSSEPSEPWNFLTRNLPPGQFRLPPYLLLLWLIGIWIRYCVLLPFRLTVLFFGFATFGFAYPLVGLVLPDGNIQQTLRKWLLRYLASVFVASWSGFIRYHGERPRRRPNQVYVANHSSLIDLFVLSKDYNFSIIGQKQNGLAGMFQESLLSAQNHLWFEHQRGQERRRVQWLLEEHVKNGENEPMLIFPEGTCTSTEYCIMFKKESFELGATVYPVALRYRKEFGDAYWNSMQTSFARHLFDLMTSWSVVCDVYYLEPQQIRQGESAPQFAARVKDLICRRACLTSVNWNGFLKRKRISSRFLAQRQKAFAAVLHRRMSGQISCISAAAELGQPCPAPGTAAGPALRSRGRTAGRGEKDALDTPASATPRSTLVRTMLSKAVAFVTDAFQNTVRWGIALLLLSMITLISLRMAPMSWKKLIADLIYRFRR